MKPYCCTVCKELITQKTSVSMHMAGHNVESSYQCRICKEVFTHKTSLIIHTTGHTITGDSSYQCRICSKYFASEYIRSLHLRQFRHDNKYQCSGCKGHFSTHCVFLRHITALCKHAPILPNIFDVSDTIQEADLINITPHKGEEPYSAPDSDVNTVVSKDDVKSME